MAIADAIKQILALFALNDNAPQLQLLDGWAPMPAGPPPRAVTPGQGCWLAA